ALILALAAFLTLVAVGNAGTDTAGAALPFASVTEALLPGLTGSSSSSTETPSSGSTTTTTPSTTPTTPSTTTPVPQCSDGIDNDGDGLIDMEDPDCSSPSDETEGPEASTSPSTPPTATTTSPSTSASGSTEAGEPIGDGSEAKPKEHKDFSRGESLEEEVEPEVRGGVAHGETLGDNSGGGKSGGGVKAPSATGGGTQPLPENGDGGAQFELGGAPNLLNPTTTIAPFGPAPIGVPNFVINSFEIPPFLLPIYQACGTEYGIPWEVLAAINKIETDFGK